MPNECVVSLCVCNACMHTWVQENERLYSELERLRKEIKSSQAQLFHDNQQLRKELLNVG